MTNAVQIKEKVKDHYTRAVEGRGGCCGPAPHKTKREAGEASPKSGCCGGGTDLVNLSGYKKDELASLPEDAVQSSFGCGNPVAFAGVQEGQTVVDIGSGAGIDCLLAAERVGPEGQVIGLDMTPLMIERARANVRKAGADNVEFRLGDAETMPIEDGEADWIVSNCVINLAPDKKKGFSRSLSRVETRGTSFRQRYRRPHSAPIPNPDALCFLLERSPAGRGLLGRDPKRRFHRRQSGRATRLRHRAAFGSLRRAWMGRRFLATCGKPAFPRAETIGQPLAGTSSQHPGLSGEADPGASGSVNTAIRAADQSELSEVLALVSDCDLPVDGVEENLAGFLVARENETLVGTIGLECYGEVGLLRSLAVASSGRGQGLGGRLVEMLLGHAKERGVTTVYLLTETAGNFFPRFGFKKMPRVELDPALDASRELQGVCSETAVAMRLRLGQGPYSVIASKSNRNV